MIELNFKTCAGQCLCHSVFSSSYTHLLCVCVCVCMHMCVCVCVCMHMARVYACVHAWLKEPGVFDKEGSLSTVKTGDHHGV
jgi:hypothetical protein